MCLLVGKGYLNAYSKFETSSLRYRVWNSLFRKQSSSLIIVYKCVKFKFQSNAAFFCW